MKALIIAAAVVLSSGCASKMPMPIHDDFYDWKMTHEALPFTWHYVPQEAVQAYCSKVEQKLLLACAYWIEGDHCWIFTAHADLHPETRLHEEKHCEGYNHTFVQYANTEN